MEDKYYVLTIQSGRDLALHDFEKAPDGTFLFTKEEAYSKVTSPSMRPLNPVAVPACNLKKVTMIMNHSESKTPENYICAECGTKGVKLWREHAVTPNHQVLRCVECACKKACVTGTVGIDGRIKLESGEMTDQIGSLLPAIPTKELDGYWAYVSVPEKYIDWWKALPLTKDGRVELFA